MTTHAGDFVEIHVTCGTAEEADAIANLLVRHHLAACVKTAPVRSVYRWEGEVQHDDEVLLVATTRSALFERVVAEITDLHSYELPAIALVPITPSPDHGRWIHEETTPPPAT